MDTVSTISLYAALVTTGLMAGVYLAFSIAVLPGIARADDSTFVSAMRGMNAAILNPVFGLVFGGPLVFGVVAVATRLPDGDGISSIGAAARALHLDVADHRWDQRAAEQPARQHRATGGGARPLERTWVRWNVVRTVLCTASSSSPRSPSAESLLLGPDVRSTE